MLKQIRNWTSLLALAALGVHEPAQDFPNRPVKILVPQTPGGASDALARIMAQKLSEKWGQPVVVENRAGAGGNVGMEVVATAPADGYTLLMGYVGTQAINGALYKKLPFDPEKDFAPVATLATLPSWWSPAPTRRSRPSRSWSPPRRRASLTYGSAGNGSVNHLLGEMFNAAAGVKLVHVPYRGAAPAMQDLMGGQIELVFTSLPSVAGSIKQGTLHPIAVTSAKRAASFSQHPHGRRSGLSRTSTSIPGSGCSRPPRCPRRSSARSTPTSTKCCARRTWSRSSWHRAPSPT